MGLYNFSFNLRKFFAKNSHYYSPNNIKFAYRKTSHDVLKSSKRELLLKR